MLCLFLGGVELALSAVLKFLNAVVKPNSANAYEDKVPIILNNNKEGVIHKKTPLKDVINFYPLLVNELSSLGYRYFEDLKKEGWEKICRRYSKLFPERLNVDVFVLLLASFEGLRKRKITDKHREKARTLAEQIKREIETPTGAIRKKKRKT